MSRWMQAEQHLVPEREEQTECSLPAQLVGFWPSITLFPPLSPFYFSARTFRSATEHLLDCRRRGAPSPAEAKRRWEDEGKAGEKVHSGKQQHLLSRICLSLASHRVWQLERHEVRSAISDMDVESSHFFPASIIFLFFHRFAVLMLNSLRKVEFFCF